MFLAALHPQFQLRTFLNFLKVISEVILFLNAIQPKPVFKVL